MITVSTRVNSALGFTGLTSFMITVQTKSDIQPQMKRARFDLTSTRKTLICTLHTLTSATTRPCTYRAVVIHLDSPAGCRYGDRSRWCAGIFAMQCYDIADRCCETCKSMRSGPQGCEYGDKIPNCSPAMCSYETQERIQATCCGTCSKVTTTLSQTSDVDAEASTSSGTTGSTGSASETLTEKGTSSSLKPTTVMPKASSSVHTTKASLISSTEPVSLSTTAPPTTSITTPGKWLCLWKM